MDYFTQAIVHDPSYAPAYVGLADCYNLLREYTVMPASEAYPRALAAAQKAVELDDQSSEAHASLAFALFYGTWNVADADREFRRAIELNPNNAVAHHWYATYLATLGHTPEAVVEIEKAQTLDPASKSVLADKGNLLWAAGRRDEGTALLKQLAASEPDFVSPHRYLKSNYFVAGDYGDFLIEWRKEATLMHDKSALKTVDTADKGFAAGGEQGMLRSMLAEQQNNFTSVDCCRPIGWRRRYCLLGDKREALQYLHVAYDKHDEATIQIQNDPSFSSLHNDPGYKDLIARLGLPALN